MTAILVTRVSPRTICTPDCAHAECDPVQHLWEPIHVNPSCREVVKEVLIKIGDEGLKTREWLPIWSEFHIYILAPIMQLHDNNKVGALIVKEPFHSS